MPVTFAEPTSKSRKEPKRFGLRALSIKIAPEQEKEILPRPPPESKPAEDGKVQTPPKKPAVGKDGKAIKRKRFRHFASVVVGAKLQKEEDKNVVDYMQEGRLMKVADNNEERILDVDSHHTFLSFTSPPKWYILLPTYKWRILWDVFITFLLAYYAVAIPMAIAFEKFIIHIAVEIILSCIFIIDIGFCFITAYDIEYGKNHGWIETRVEVISKRYVESWLFVDIISTIPLDIIVGDGFIAFRMLRLGRLLRVLRLGRIFKRLFNFWRVHPSMVRLFKYIVILVLVLHWIACIKWFIGDVHNFDNEWNHGYRDGEETDIVEKTVGYQYTTALLWAIWVSTGTGQTGYPERSIESTFTAVATLSGFLCYAFIVGSASSALTDIDDSTVQKRKQLNEMQVYLEQRQTDPRLISEIVAYYDYCWARNLDVEEHKLFTNLHGTLKRNLVFSLHKHLIMKVPMFHDITEPCLEAIIHALKSRVFLPNEWVCLKGERGKEMFFVCRGKFEIKPEINKPAVAVLADGESFGEASLITDKRRGASVRSLCHGELMILDAKSFKEIVHDFPIFSVTVKKHSPQVRGSKGWVKIRHAINLMQMLHKIGFYQSFESMMRDLNYSMGEQSSHYRETNKQTLRDLGTGPSVARKNFVMNSTIVPRPDASLGMILGKRASLAPRHSSRKN